ncbi:hypothetical protein AB0M20_42125 [Actinoplanes sp. NPDC051633]|uniref:hypothetical protein n=1 Tax=Actinoplanes sp. NPDC051633 TaxID=3155670 RepID=UPI00343E7D16
MSSAVLDLLSGYFSPELLEERPIMRSSLHHGGPAGVETTRADFRDLLAGRGMTHDDFYRATMTYFPDDESLYRELEDAYRFFFDEEPPTAMRG